MASPTAPVYGFGAFRLHAARRLLTGCDGTPVSLTPKAYDTLAYLLEHAGAVVNKDELMRAIWPDTVVEENNLTQNISLLRRALGEGRGDHRFIATVPGRGYQFIAPVRVADAQPAGMEPADEKASIAVLPFVNVSTDPDYDYFGDGLAEEVINALSKLEGVRVVARTSAFSFKGKQADIREIADRLRVNLVLEGSVRKSGNRLRITAQLVNAADGYQLWSERYDREIDMPDIFGVQDEITLAVVDALKMKLPQARRPVVLKHATENVKAHELCLKGRFHVFRMTRSGIEAGISYLEKALEADPSYALAQVGLAHAYRMFGLSLEMPPWEAGPKSKAAALKAIELDESLGEAHAVLGLSLFWYEWAWSASQKHFERALELEPNNAYTHWMYAHLCSNLGRHAEALDGIARARELDPLSGFIHAMEGQFLLHAGRTDDAIDRLREALELDSKSRVAHLFTANAYIQKGRLEEAVEEASAAHAVSPSNMSALAIEAYANAKLGRHAQARGALEQCLQLSNHRYVPPYYIAVICNGLDQPGEALMWLERAFDQRDPWMAFLKVEPKWNNLRSNPRFVRLLNRLKLFP
ncbi:putative Transcriptional regulator domain-containing protein [Candidatus Sulfopaludibacter sp. SbA6]|nr:putative Transcriptional regulator domain-containing protein [Candidatus Sulfopaludibacter sp. SbA6]